MDDIYVRSYGSGEPLILLLHGMGAHGGLWEPLADRLRRSVAATLVAPDFRGHGRSARAACYSYGQHAADMAQLACGRKAVYLVGHSMGGAVALALASGWFGIESKGIFAFSTKTGFSRAERDRLEAFAHSPPKHFADQAGAVSRFLKVGGLEGLVAPDSDQAAHGVARRGDHFELAADNRSVLAATGPSLASLHAAARCPVLYACGENDPMVDADELRALGTEVELIAQAGHNPHVQAPEAMAELIVRWLRGLGVE